MSRGPFRFFHAEIPGDCQFLRVGVRRAGYGSCMSPMKIRLSGGPRDGRIVATLPTDYWITGIETYDNAVSFLADIVAEVHRYVARPTA